MTKITKPISNETVNWIHSYFRKTSIPRMSEEKVRQIVNRHTKAS